MYNSLPLILSLRIDCEYLADDDVISSCKSSNLTVVNSNETVTSVSGTLSANLEYSNITSLEIESSPELEFLPLGIQKFFPNLEKISLIQTGLKIITSDDLKNFPKMKSLILRNNKLSEIDSKLFVFNKNIEEIDFSGNEIKHVGENFLKSLENLTKLDFSNNVCFNGTANNSVEVKRLKAKLNENCQNPLHEISAFKTSAGFAVLCLIAIFVSYLLIRCIKFIVDR